MCDLIIKHKLGIAKSFSRAAPYYDRYADFQRSCGEHLSNLLNMLSFPNQRIFLDAGCGTGWFSKKWKNKGKKVIALDLSRVMLDYAKKNHSANVYLLGDVENLPLETSSIDIIFSNLVIQWCQKFSCALSECYRVLRPNGIMVLSTLAKGSLVELDYTWKSIDQNNHINRFLSQSDILSAFSQYRHYVYFQSKTFYYNTILDLLRGIKRVGANYLYKNRKKGLTGKNRLKELEKFWPHHNNGLPLSYKIIYGVIFRD